MKLTAQLAYSQLKINRGRTMWTLVGIALSSALITAVCSFAASGNALIIGLFGKSYGNYDDMIADLLLVPAGFFSAIIVSMSVVVISNAFRVSAGERTAQFGILKSVGATKRQITATVMYEGVLLSAVAIPVGIVAGLVLAYAGVQVANHFLAELNSLVNVMMNEITLVIDFVIAWQALTAAVVISFSATMFSAWLPARKAAKIAAIDSIRGAGEVRVGDRPIRTSPFVEKLFGFEGVLAAKSMKRNRRNFRAGVVSLTVGIVLYVNLSALSRQADLLLKMMSPNVDATIMVDYTSLRKTKVNEATGREETTIVVPIDSAVADGVTDKLREYGGGGTSVFGMGDNSNTYVAIVPREAVTPKMIEVLSDRGARGQQSYELSTEIITVDRVNYAELCERAGVSVGSNILLNHYSYNDNGVMIGLAPFQFDGEALRLMKADGSIRETPVHGALTRNDIPIELLPPNTHTVRLIVPEGAMRSYMWYASPADIAGFMGYANAVMDEMFPRSGESAYMDLGFTTRVFGIQDYMKIMNIPVFLVLVFLYSFVALLTLIGLTSVISTMSANVRMRSREFAVLQSVGMTPDGLRRMLNLESVICSTKALIIGLPIAIGLTYLINMPIRAKFPIPYELPWLAVVWCIAVVFAITYVTTRYSAHRLGDRNIIEAIRSGSGK